MGPPLPPFLQGPGRLEGSSALFSLLRRSGEFWQSWTFLGGSGREPDRARRLSGFFPSGRGAPGWRAMPLPRTPLLLLGVALGSFVLGASCGSLSHSLSYFYLHLPEPIQGLPQFSIRSYLNDQPITRFDSLTGKMEPLVPWMEEREKEAFLVPEWVFRADLEKLSKLGHHAGGLHTWQVVLGCEITEDGSKGGYFRYAYDGMDFISFDKENLTWGPVHPQAQKLKENWKDDPGWSEGNRVFLEETCIEWLQRYLSYRTEALQRIKPPVGKVTRKEVDDSLEVLICQPFGFYPTEIQVTWTRDGEDWEEETLSRNVAPNSDGTYYVRLSIEIDPKERDRFRCRLEHQGLQEPLILAWKEETAKVLWTCMKIVAASILGVGIFFLIRKWRRCRNNLYQEGTTCHDQTPSQSVPSFSMQKMRRNHFFLHTEDETQSLLSPQTSGHNPSCELQRTHSDPEITVSSLRRQKVKLLQKTKMELSTVAALHRGNRKKTRKTHP